MTDFNVRTLPSLPAPNRLDLGAIVIEWAWHVDNPIQVNHRGLNGRCVFITGCEVTFRFVGLGLAITVPARFIFDGASVPPWLQWIPGFAPLGKHIWAALLHDWLCVLCNEQPHLYDRNIADAMFAALLEHTGVDGWRGTAMDLAVNSYRRFRSLRGDRSNGRDVGPDQASHGGDCGCDHPVVGGA